MTADSDDDNDLVEDSDVFPLNNSEWVDTD